MSAHSYMHGIKNLPCGKANGSLLNKTLSANKYSINVETDIPFKLVKKIMKALKKLRK